MKRIIDFCFSFLGIFFLFPIFIITSLLVFFNDFNFPFYTPLRMGRNMKPFRMFKFRSMILNADNLGGTSTSINDKRVTSIGKIIRRYKLDELSQLLNVFIGDMSFVGPRPQVIDHVKNEYTEEEKKILNIKPGITDFSSIIFSDEGDILANSKNPDFDYNQLIRPWKSRLAIFYLNKRNIIIDFQLIFFTLISIYSREIALKLVTKKLVSLGADIELVQISSRKSPLKPKSLLGSSKTVIVKN